jgi:hypothetical protein
MVARRSLFTGLLPYLPATVVVLLAASGNSGGPVLTWILVGVAVTWNTVLYVRAWRRPRLTRARQRRADPFPRRR